MNKLRNIPALKTALALASGILIGANFNIEHEYILTILALLLLTGILTYKKHSSKIFFTGIIYSMLITFGIFRAGLDFYTLPENSIAHIPDTPEKEKYKIAGIINDIPDEDSNRVRFNMEVNGIITAHDTIAAEGEIIASIYGSKYKNETPPKFKAGDKVVLTGRLVTPWGERNPGEFDYRNYLMLHDIYKSFLVYGYDNAEFVSGDNLGFIEGKIIFPSKEFAIREIERDMSGDEAEYLKGLVAGERNDISRETKDEFIKTGVMHLIAVSGLNVAYVIIIIATVLGIFRVYFKKRAILIITALIFYCVFTGSSPSIVRATIMGILLLLAYESEMKTNFYNIAGFSAMIILIFNPKQLFDPGFILSYTAVLSMVFCYERFKPALIDSLDNYDWKYKRYLKYLMILAVTTLAAQIGVLPVAGGYFEKVSVISIFTNLIVVPLANLSLAIGFMQILTATVSEYLASIIASANMEILSFQLWFIKQCASLDFAYFEVYRFDTVNVILYFTALIIVITASRRNYKFRLAMAGLIIPAVILHNADTDKQFRASFLDTGKGECTVLQTPDGRTIVIDCGTKTDTYDSGERTIVPYLKRNGIDRIDLLILTGTGPNKTGGLEYIAGNFSVTKIIKGRDMNPDYYLEKTIKENGIKSEEAGTGDLIDQIKNTRVYFFNGKKELTVKVVYKNLKILFATKETTLTKKFADTDILRIGKLPKEQIMKEIAPKMTISTDNHNMPESKIISTNQRGAVLIKSNGENIQIINY